MNYLILLFFLLQYFFEFWLSAKNGSKIQDKLQGTIIDKNEAQVSKLFYGLWFFSLLTESVYHGSFAPLYTTIPIVAILLFAQFLNFTSMRSMGEYWTIQIIKFPNHPSICKSGPYQYIRHPNYLAKLIQFIFLPLLLGCPFTMVVGFILKLSIIKNKIRLEEEILSSSTNYNFYFQHKKRFIPMLF